MDILLADLRLDGGTQARTELDDTTVERYRADMEKGDQFPPITVYSDGLDYWLADGFHRVEAARRIGWTLFHADVHQGGRREATLAAVAANTKHGLPRSNADKRRAVEMLLLDEEWGKWSDRKIADQCGVSHPFVGSVRAELSGNGFQMPERTAERNGTTYTIDTSNIGKRDEAGEAHPVTDDYLPDLDGYQPGLMRQRAEEPPAPDFIPALDEPTQQWTDRVSDRQPDSPAPEVATFKESRNHDEWYTRPEHIASVKAVLGSIDLDPASCEAANATVGAKTFYTKDQDGLAQYWEGDTAYLNCPYSNAADWVARMIDAYEQGQVKEAIVLVNANTSSAWFSPLWDHTVCFVEGRVSFIAGDGGKSQTGWSPSVFVYFGPRPEAFAREFRKYGRIVRAWDDWAPQEQQTQREVA